MFVSDLERLYCKNVTVRLCCCQALDGAFNQENRQKCKEATGPLIEAVDNLTAFASNPEFASMPAQISPEVRRSQLAVMIYFYFINRVAQSVVVGSGSDGAHRSSC